MPKVLNNSRVSIVKLSFIILVSFFFFSNSSGFFFSRLIDDTSYYSHGPIALIAFIWILRKRFRQNRGITEADNKKSDIYGLSIIFFSVLVYLAGIWSFINTFQSIAIYFFILGNIVLFLGSSFVLKNPGVFIYLFLAFPIPKEIIDLLTFDLRLFASYISENILSLIYPSIVRSGNILNINGNNIIITPACSGLQNILGMILLTFFLALCQSKKGVKVFDYIIAVPAALISNILRIVIVCILAVSYDWKFALEDWHEEIGIIIFLLIFIIISLINESPFKKTAALNKSIFPFPKYKNKFINAYMFVLLLFLLVSLFIPNEFNASNNIDNTLLNDRIPNVINGWQSEDIQFEDNYFTILGTKDILMRSYCKKAGGNENETVYLFMTRSKMNRRFAHSPKDCLEGEGYNLFSEDIIDISINKEIISCNRMLFTLDKKGLLVYYWYNSNQKNYRNILNLFLSFLFIENRKSGGSMIRLSCVVNLDNPESGDKALQHFAGEAGPEILKEL